MGGEKIYKRKEEDDPDEKEDEEEMRVVSSERMQFNDLNTVGDAV